ncbi:MAG: hypothetical protein L3J51_10900 [Cocleimonas sp.]|nr:hypothetical protein [Cocleimonas sp.]
MNKIDKERHILKLAYPLLTDLYGSFDVNPNQLDRPDAAINLMLNNIQIGIEVTLIDKPKNCEYLNNEKLSKGVQEQQVKDLLNNGTCSTQPIKKVSIPFPNDYIFENVIKKAKKYQSYMESEEYTEMLILSFSSHLNIKHHSFNDYIKPWTAFLLSEKQFPFDKVIFVCEETKKAVVIYDKNLREQVPPERDSTKESGITTLQSSIIPFGKEFNINEIFDKEPHVLTKKKSRKKRK